MINSSCDLNEARIPSYPSIIYGATQKANQNHSKSGSLIPADAFVDSKLFTVQQANAQTLPGYLYFGKIKQQSSQ